MAIVAEKKDSLENVRFAHRRLRLTVANYIISQLRKEFPNAEYIINGEVYGDEDLYIDIYVDEAELLA